MRRAPYDNEVPPPDDAPKPSAEALANTMVHGYFHFDIERDFEVKLTPGVYELSLFYGGSRSETKRFELLP